MWPIKHAWFLFLIIIHFSNINRKYHAVELLRYISGGVHLYFSTKRSLPSSTFNNPFLPHPVHVWWPPVVEWAPASPRAMTFLTSPAPAPSQLLSAAVLTGSPPPQGWTATWNARLYIYTSDKGWKRSAFLFYSSNTNYPWNLKIYTFLYLKYILVSTKK